MRALLNATGYNPALAPLMRRNPAPLLRIADKPIIIHVIERLVFFGIRQFDLILHHFPDRIEECLGEGERWGARITFHLATDLERPFAAVIPASFNWTEDSFLLGDVEILPKLHVKQLERIGGRSRFFFHRSRGWIGWGIVATESLQHLDKATPYTELPQQLEHFERVNVNGVLLSVKTLRDWQQSNHRILNKNTPTNLFPATARMVEPAIWLSHGMLLHPSAIIKAPVFIGDSCQVMEGAQIGPDAVIESHCIIDKNSVIARSIVCRESYVGEDLEVYHCIVDQHTLINLALDTVVDVQDDFILGHVQPPSLLSHIQDICQSLAALALLLSIAPIFAFLTTRYGIKTRAVAKLPVAEGNHPWATFKQLEFNRDPNRWLKRLPSLVNVLRRDMHWIGLPPRTMDEIQELPEQWQRFILTSRVGWITTTDLEPNGDPYTTEAFYATHNGFLAAFLKRIRDKLRGVIGLK